MLKNRKLVMLQLPIKVKKPHSTPVLGPFYPQNTQNWNFAKANFPSFSLYFVLTPFNNQGNSIYQLTITLEKLTICHFFSKIPNKRFFPKKII